jgi:hypothetical protein
MVPLAQTAVDDRNRARPRSPLRYLPLVTNTTADATRTDA